MRVYHAFGLALAAVFALPVQAVTTTTLFSETFDNVNVFPGTHWRSGDPQWFGVPTSTTAGSDEDWYGARFEQPNNGSIAQDVGVQKIGGGSPYNGTPVGLVEDDAGLMFRLDTTGYTNVTLSFDWRTFSAYSNDRFVVGYFVGDLDAGHPYGFAADRTIDLRNTVHGGPADGDWNWNPVGNGNQGNEGAWIELLRGNPTNYWQAETFGLTLASDQAEVWVAFWLDNGEDDFGKFDNVTVTATVIPVPAAVWLFGSGLLGLVGVARRRR